MAFTDSGAPGTWKRWVYDYGPDLVRRTWGSRMFVGVYGALFDRVSEALKDSILGSYHKGEPGPAYDAPRLLGKERSMPQYPNETWAQYVSRLQTDWATWELAGDENTIINQLDLAGAPGAQIFRFSENGSPFEFVVFYPFGSHPVTSETLVGSGWTVGDGTAIGPIGITAEELRAYKDLIIHWKPARWKCPWIIWETGGWTVGSGHTIGESGLTIGGTQVRTKVQ